MNTNRNLTIAAGAGILGLTGAGYAGSHGVRRLLVKQAEYTRNVIGKPFGDTPPDASGLYRHRYVNMGEPVELLILGDSIAAGLGAFTRQGTLGAKTAKKLADELQLPVRLRVEARSGNETTRVLSKQIPRLEPDYRPDYTLLIVGANDVIHQVPLEKSMAALKSIIDELQSRNTRLVVGTCPNLGLAEIMPRFLRSVVGLASQRLEAAQIKYLRSRNVTMVHLGKTLSKEWRNNADDYFSQDHFHPSHKGYRMLSDAIAPALLIATTGPADVVASNRAKLRRPMFTRVRTNPGSSVK